MIKQINKRILAWLLIISMVASLCGTPFSYGTSEESVAPLSNADGIQFDVGMYKDADRTQLETALTAEGSTLTGWTYLGDTISAEDRYLGVSLEGLLMDAQYQIVIEMDPILYFNLNTDPVLTNTTVSFTSNDPITVNTTGAYQVNKYSLSNLTYVIDKGVTGLTLGLPVRFDTKLWNKQNGGALGDGTSPLLKVYLQKLNTDGTAENVENCDVALKQATVKGSINHSIILYKYLNGGSVDTSVISPEDYLKALFYHFNVNAYNDGHYAKDVEIKITIPSCTIDGETYRADYRNFKFETNTGKPKFTESFDEATGILTITAQNIYFHSSRCFNMELSAPEAVKAIPGKHTFSGSIAVVENGVTVTSKTNLSFVLDNSNEAIIKAVGSSGTANTIHPDIVHHLGTMAMRNEAATAGSGPLWIDLAFDTNKTNAVHVTTVNLMADNIEQNILVKYTLVDGDGNPAYPDADGNNQAFFINVSNKKGNIGKVDATNLTVRLTRSMLPEEHRQYFFETVSYTMDDLPGNTFAYAKSGNRGTSSGGTFWGYANVSSKPSVLPIHTIKIYQRANDGSRTAQLASATAKTDFNGGTSVPFGLTGASVSDSVISAGDSVTISGKLDVSSYPYTSNGTLENPCLAFILPVGITVNTASITAKTNKGIQFVVKEVKQKAVSGDKVLYLIAFEGKKPIGYYTEGLEAIANGYRINFSVQLNSEKALSQQTIKLRESVFAAGYHTTNGASGAWEKYKVTDVYDINENGKTTDSVGSFSESVQTSVEFQASPAALAITDEMQNEAGEHGSEINMESFADVLTYNLNVNCTEGGSASDFYYIIPIAKKSIIEDTDFVENCDVDLRLHDQATVDTKQGTAMKVLYSTTAADSYTNALNLTDWSETLPAGKQWEDVTFVKVVSAEEIIVNGSANTISVPLRYAGERDEDYVHMAGYQIEWSSRGYYHYTIGHNSNAGMKSTKGCTITLTYTAHDPICFTLTAAKDGEPKGEGASAMYSFDLPEFYLAQEYSVKQIKPYNVNLMPSTYDFDSATGTEANENFRINISVQRTDGEQSSSPIAMQKDNDIIGSLSGQSAPRFTFFIENADALSDIVTERYVHLTLIGNNGVIVPIEITIKRELAAADATDSAIVAGELHAPFNGETSIKLSRDSAFTAQFVTNYIPSNYKDFTLVFEKTPVSGTKITMMDYTDPDALGVYHYEMDGTTNTIALKSFVAMGSNDRFAESAVTTMVKETLLFIVEAPDSGEAIQKNTLSLTKVIKTGTDETVPPVLHFETVERRKFGLSTSMAQTYIGNNFTVAYTSECDVVDSRYTGRALSIVVGPAEGKTFPEDAKLVVNGTGYALNSDGIFLIPLKAVQTGSGSVEMSYHTASNEEATLLIDLWASATAEGAKPLMGTKVVSTTKQVTINPTVKPSFKVLGMGNRLLKAEDLQNTITVSFEKLHAEKVTLELQQKISTDYVTQTTLLESVNGKTAADAGQGIFTVSGNSAKIKLSTSMPTGTYRLLFKASNGDEEQAVPYNFILIN